MSGPCPENLTICICTHNRARVLAECLSSLTEQADIERVRVLVVANNCTDDTGEVVDSFRERLPLVGIVHEPNPGVASARNRALAETMTEYMAFLDDDVKPTSDWLVEVISAFSLTGADLVTGKITPYWPGRKPWWVNEAFYPLLSQVDRGEGLVAIEDYFVPGANMAFRTEALRAAGGFDPKLGVCSTDSVEKTVYLGEEPAAAKAMAERGSKIVYTGKAEVLHLTNQERCSITGLKRRAAQSGATRALLKLAEPQAAADELAWAVGCIAACLVRGRGRTALFYYFRSVNCWHALKEFHRLDRSSPPAWTGYTRGVWRQRRGLMGLLRKTLMGSQASMRAILEPE